MSNIITKSNIELEYEEFESKKSWETVLMSLHETSNKSSINETFEYARKSCNKSRNRYTDNLPYDSNRVKLPVIRSSDYINASFVNLENNKYKRKYILTQEPLVSTVSHFWLMVWNESSDCIVTLNKILEKDATKCTKYFPTQNTDNENYVYPDIDLSLSLIESHTNMVYIKRIFLLKNSKTEESRSITQFHYQSWPDFGVPSSTELFLQFLSDVRASGKLDDPEKPAIVHCSAGIGRSGTFILIDFCLLQVADEKSTKSLNIQEILLQLRQCRRGLVETADQLRFAYYSIISGAKAL